MKRTMMLSFFSIFVVLFVNLHTVQAQELQKTKQLPNIIYIMADDLGYAELGCYSQTKIKTPNIDRLAAEGIRLTQHYSGAPVCAPSRCVLMTGKHTGHSEVRGNKEVGTWESFRGQHPLSPDAITIAKLLKEKGYKTGCFGKWGLGEVGSTGDPLNQGFDRFFGYNCQRHAHNYYPRYLISNREQIKLEGNDRKPTGEQYAPQLIADELINFIKANKDEQFFVYYPSIIPHLALQVPEEGLSEYKGLWDDPPYTGGKGYLPHDNPRAAYAAMVSFLDSQVGRIMNLLVELGLDDNTLVVFTSDNGPTYNRIGGSDSDFFASAGPLRGLKGSLYEGGIRVPWIARWPGRIETGAVSDHISASWDVLPTLTEIVDLPVPDGIDGLSLVPTLLKNKEQEKHEYLYWEFPSYGGQQVVRIGDWKGVRQRMQKGNLEIELYNLSEDIGESNNVADEHPDIVKRIREIMNSHRIPSKNFPIKALDETN